MKKVTVTLELKPVSVELEVSKTLSDQEIVKLAKEDFINQATKEFPGVVYRISEGNTLTFDKAFVGQVVKDKETSKYGIVTKINKKTINVAVGNGTLQGPPQCFEAVEENFDIEQIGKERIKVNKDLAIWREGNTGYLVIPQDKTINFVAVTKVTGAGNHQLYPINKDTKRYWNLNTEQMKRMVFDTREEAEKFAK